MSRVRRIVWLAGYSLCGTRRRWIAFLAPGLLAVLALSQVPRLAGLAALFARPSLHSRAVMELAELVGSLYDTCLLVGAIYALVVGTMASGSRNLRGHLAPILARPVCRGELVVARFVAGAGLVLSFWLLPALGFEVCRAWIDAPVRVTPQAYLFPLALHWLLLAAGMAAGAYLPALPASFAGLGGVWACLALLGLESSTATSLSLVGATWRWCAPPLDELVRAATPFASAPPNLPRVALAAQALAWIGIFLFIAIRRFERADFIARGE